MGLDLRHALVAGCLALSLFGCSLLKRQTESDEGTTGSGSPSAAATAAPPTTVAADPPPAAPSGAAAAPSGAASGAVAPPNNPNPADAPAPPATNAVPVRPQQSIEPCCAALAAYQHSGRPAGVKATATRAAGICRGIADTVRQGKSSRAQGLAQVKSLLNGAAAPPECN